MQNFKIVTYAVSKKEVVVQAENAEEAITQAQYPDGYIAINEICVFDSNSMLVLKQ